ncbi:MAG TPA: hypothetical protein VMB84_05085 [Stellaceae bacterium]|nr:hypothetical protein [Stellaceae bacterium]
MRLFRPALCLLLLVFAGGALAATSWDGTWGGGQNGDGIQIVIADNRAIGVARGDSYPEILSSAASPEGTMFIVWWVGGDGLLQRTGEREATIILRERDKPPRSFALQRD